LRGLNLKLHLVQVVVMFLIITFFNVFSIRYNQLFVQNVFEMGMEWI